MDTNRNSNFASVLHVFILLLQHCWGWGEGLLLQEENILIKVLLKVLSNPNMHGKCTCGKRNVTLS